MIELDSILNKVEDAIMCETQEEYLNYMYKNDYNIMVVDSLTFDINGPNWQNGTYIEKNVDAFTKRPYLLFRITHKDHPQLGYYVLSDFKCNLPFTLLIPNEQEVNIKRFVPICACFHELRARVWLDTPDLPDKITFSMVVHDFKRDIRKELADTISDGLIDGECIYRNGMVGIRRL